MTVVTIPALGQYGLVIDQPAQELPVNAFSRVENMRFANGIAGRFNGNVQVFDVPSVTPYWVGPYGTAANRYWIHAGLAAVYADDGTTRTDITGTAPTGAIDDRWTGGTLNGVFFLNNGKDKPMFWGGDTALNLATLTDWGATHKCKSLGSYKVFLIAAGVTKGTTEYPHMIKWSSAADPGSIPASWDHTSATNDAGERDLAETPGIIVDQLGLGELHIIYKEDSMYSLQYIGGQEVFATRCFTKNYGMLARGCAANTPKGHVVLTSGDVVLHQGQGEPQSLLTARLKDWLFETQIDTTNNKRCFVVANPAENECWICYPEYGEAVCTSALVWNWADNTFGLRDLRGVTYAAHGLLSYAAAESWGSDSESWSSDATVWNQNDYTPTNSRLIMTRTAPELSLADAGTTFDGTAISAILERAGLAFDTPDTVKTWRSITPRVIAAVGTVVYIQLGASMDSETAPEWGDPITYTVGETFKAFGFASGRFLAYRIYSSGSQAWSVKSVDADFTARGAW